MQRETKRRSPAHQRAHEERRRAESGAATRTQRMIRGARSSTNQAGSGGFSVIPTFDLTAAKYAGRYIVSDHTVQFALQSRTTSFTRKIDAETNVITALVCHADGGQLAAECAGSTVRVVESRLH